LRAAVNETVAFHAILSLESGGATVSGIAMTDLVGSDATIDAEQTRVYREDYVAVSDYPAWFYRCTPYRRARREYADVLIPVVPQSRALPAPLEAGRNLPWWIDLHVPRGTPPGEYTGQLEVRFASGAAVGLEVRLEVRPFALPDSPHVLALVPLSWRTLVAYHVMSEGRPYTPVRLVADDPLRSAALASLDETFRLLRAHRCDGMLMDLEPIRQTDAQGRLLLEWVDYDAVASAYLDGDAFADRVPVAAWPLPMDEARPDPEVYGGVGSPRYAEAVRLMAEACLTHFRQRGWGDRQFVPLLRDRVGRGTEYAAYERWAKVFHAAAPELRLWCALPPQSMAPFGWLGHPFRDLSGVVDVWCPTARYADPAVLAALHERGSAAWWRPDHPPYSGSYALAAEAVDVTSLGWQAAQWAGDGMWLDHAADWPMDQSAAGGRANWRALVDGRTRWLLYPGGEYGLGYPIPSVRLKWLRRGMQDAEYLWLLRQQDRPAVANLVASSLFSFGGTDAFGEHHADGRAYGWVRDPAMWRLGRELLAAELVRASRGEPTEEFAEFHQRLEWQRFLLGSRPIRGWAEGVRVRLAGGRLSGPGEGSGARPRRIDVALAMWNPTSHKAGATIECGALPEGWHVVEPVARFDVPAGQLGRRTLTIEAPTLDLRGAGLDGAFDLSVTLADPPDLAIEVPARVAVIRAMRLATAPVIDGDLRDWPPGEFNSAGDFVLLGAQHAPKAAGDKPDRATEPTAAFVGFDDDALYVAFNCADSAMDQRTITRTNYVRYEGMTPTGDDLVELMLDPTGEAVGPGDLYHVVVKANGSVIAERGIGCFPPIGPHEHWPAALQVGVDDTTIPGRWLVEMRIPFAALGPAAAANRPGYWGINFARLHPRLGEYATWSAARWNAYTPTTLGNLWMPE
jgi:hypothetical protein